MTYHRIYTVHHLSPQVRHYFKGTSVRNFCWIESAEEGTILPTEDAVNVKSYFKTVAGREVVLEPVLPEELKNAIKT